MSSTEIFAPIDVLAAPFNLDSIHQGAFSWFSRSRSTAQRSVVNAGEFFVETHIICFRALMLSSSG